MCHVIQQNLQTVPSKLTILTTRFTYILHFPSLASSMTIICFTELFILFFTPSKLVPPSFSYKRERGNVVLHPTYLPILALFYYLLSIYRLTIYPFILLHLYFSIAFNTYFVQQFNTSLTSISVLLLL